MTDGEAAEWAKQAHKQIDKLPGTAEVQPPLP
jgi:hypothetical protein